MFRDDAKAFAANALAVERQEALSGKDAFVQEQQLCRDAVHAFRSLAVHDWAAKWRRTRA